MQNRVLRDVNEQTRNLTIAVNDQLKDIKALNAKVRELEKTNKSKTTRKK